MRAREGFSSGVCGYIEWSYIPTTKGHTVLFAVVVSLVASLLIAFLMLVNIPEKHL